MRFRITVHKGVIISNDTVGYPPIINVPANEMVTVDKILIKSNNIMNDLHIKSVVFVFDQALYANVLEVLWKHKNLHQGIIIRMISIRNL